MSSTAQEQERSTTGEASDTVTTGETSNTVTTVNNPAYGITLGSRGTRPTVPQPYEDIDLQEGNTLYTSLTVTDHNGTAYQTLVPQKPPSMTSSRRMTSTTKLTLLVTLLTTTTVVGLILILGVIIAVLHTTASNGGYTYMQEIKTLQEEVQTLRKITNLTSQENETALSDFSEQILLKIAEFKMATDTQLASHSNRVQDLQTAMESLANQVNTIATHVNSSNQDSLEETGVAHLQTTVNTITNKVNSLQSTVDTLTTRVNSSVNLYQNCIKDTANCQGNPLASTSYRRACITPALPVNTTVSV